ncbi:hypothetical protein [Streptomyces sp. WG7]|uniref:hypothetical protein n=1 Tax=Streptomyces sp. WG7 TaxID=3417650 RepID=UPI003CFA1A00
MTLVGFSQGGTMPRCHLNALGGGPEAHTFAGIALGNHGSPPRACRTSRARSLERSDSSKAEGRYVDTTFRRDFAPDDRTPHVGMPYDPAVLKEVLGARTS